MACYGCTNTALSQQRIPMETDSEALTGCRLLEEMLRISHN